MVDEQVIERVLVITAHPDDVDFGAAGTVATWTDAGIDVSYCLVTDGDAGGHDRTVSRVDMIEIRRAEQTAAAKHVGVTDLHFLGFPDGCLEPTLDLRRELSRVIREVKPQRVLSPSPERNYQRIFASHPDHLAAGEAALCAVYPDARNPFAHPALLDAGLEPWTVSEVWMMATPTPDTFVDITNQIDRKLDALRCHVSQHQDPAMLEGLIRDWGTMIAEAAGYPNGRYAEGFQRVPTT